MVRSIGADAVIDYTREDYARNGKQYDVIFDLVANHSYAEHQRVLTSKGIYIGAGIIGLGGSMIRLLRRQLPELVAWRFGSQRSLNLLAKLNQKDLLTIAALISEGKVTPVIDDRHYNLSEANEAVRYLEEGHARGKVIISVEHT